MDLRAAFDELARRHLVPTGVPAADARQARDVADAADAAAKTAALARYRALIAMQESGMSLAQIASELGVARGTAQTLLTRAKDAVREPGGDEVVMRSTVTQGDS